MMRTLLWANSLGIEGYLEAVGNNDLVGIVAAANRPNDLPRVKALAQSVGVPLLVQPFRKNTAAFEQFAAAVRRTEAELFLVNAYSMLLDAKWLGWPALAALNVHTGLLPEYRGANVLNWALVNGEREAGVTIHHLDEGVDTGDIVLQQRVAIDWTDTAVTLRDKLLAEIPPMLQQVVAMARRGNLPRHPQDSSRARHWPRRRPEDGLIDWSWPAERIYNLIRALVAPWPGAFYIDADGRRVVLDRFVPLDEVRFLKRRYASRHAATHRCDTSA